MSDKRIRPCVYCKGSVRPFLAITTPPEGYRGRMYAHPWHKGQPWRVVRRNLRHVRFYVPGR